MVQPNVSVRSSFHIPYNGIYEQLYLGHFEPKFYFHNMQPGLQKSTMSAQITPS